MSKEIIRPPLNSFYDTIIWLLSKTDKIALYDDNWTYLYKGTISNFPTNLSQRNIWWIEMNGQKLLRFWPGNNHWFTDRKEIPHYLEKLKERKIAIETIKTKKNIDAIMGMQDEDFSDFSVKHGETDIESYWYEFRNVAAKKLKEKWIFEWGNYRLYFDIWFDDFEILKDLIIGISSKEKIAIAFKYLDKKKSHLSDTSDESETTHFVANFKDIGDAKKLYKILSETPEYKELKLDKKREYNGYPVDEICTYANKYREQRAALWQMIKTAHFIDSHTVEYTRLNWKPMKILSTEYDSFITQFKEMEDSIKEWGKD